jgi:ELWxxDGT repeat protein
MGARVYVAEGAFDQNVRLWALAEAPGADLRAEEITVAGGSGDLLEIIAAGERLFWVIERGERRHELWVSDGTAAGTDLLKTFEPAVAYDAPHGLTAAHDTLYFAADDGASGAELWRSDGTPEGTSLVADLAPGAAHGVPLANEVAHSAGPRFFKAHALGDRLLFSAIRGDESALYSSDGTAEGTAPLGSGGEAIMTAGAKPGNLVALGDRLLFVADDGRGSWELFASDGTPPGTALIGALSEAPFPETNALPVMGYAMGGPVVVGDALYFVREHGVFMWRSDGTPAGTRVLESVPGAPPPDLRAALISAGDGSGAFQVVAMGGRAYYYRGDEEARTLQLWRADAASQELVLDTGLPAMWFAPFAPLVYAGGRLFFFGDNGGSGLRLLATDGTAAGSQTLFTTDPERSSLVMPQSLTVVSDRLFFIADDGEHGRELWVSDGTPDGTRMVRDIREGAVDGKPAAGICAGDEMSGPRMYAYDGLLYFPADDGVHGCELWRSDGTADGTRLVHDVRPGGASSLRWPTEMDYAVALVTWGEQVVFVADDGEHGAELWLADAAGARLVRDIAPGLTASAPEGLTTAGGKLFFSATDGEHGRELWVSDGSEAGTLQVADLSPGLLGSEPHELTPAGATLYLVADDGIHGEELWALPLATR